MKIEELERKVRLGQGAYTLLHDETAQELLEAMREHLLTQIESHPTDNADAIMAMTRQLRAVRQFKAHLEGYEQTGRHAATELERFRERK